MANTTKAGMLTCVLAFALGGSAAQAQSETDPAIATVYAHTASRWHLRVDDRLAIAAPSAPRRVLSAQGTGAQTAGPGSVSDNWRFVFTPYLWAMDQSGEVKIGPFDPTFNVPFTTALKSLEGAFMGHFEARKSRVGIATDLVWAKVGSDLSPDEAGVSGKVDLSMTFWGLGPYYRFGDGKSVFDVFGGIRYNHIGTDIVVSETGQNAKRTLDWVDPIVGGRWIGTLSPKISVGAEGDIGGFGAGSKLTFRLQGELVWQFHRVAGLVIGYRWLDYDYEKGVASDPDYFKFDNSMYGPAVGLSLSW